ncbi:MAG: hypothetical protein M3Z29_08805 [Pseudomonadota bacterium]|nr:hypothetical protein [Pseudomonadota bacterium]
MDATEEFDALIRQEFISYVLCLGTDEDADSIAVSTKTIQAVSALINELKPLVGESAARALYGRALHLAKSSFERPAGMFETVADMLTPLSRDLGARQPDEAKAASSALLRSFVDLLVSLIGEPLTYRMLGTAWGVPSLQRPAKDSMP